jgi:hypothetical protein
MANETKRERLRAFLASGKWNALMIVDAILESPLSNSEKLTLIAIGSHRSESSQYPNPGLRRLGELTSMKPHTVGAVVERLHDAGILRTLKRERQVNTYDLSGTMAGLLAVYPNGTASVPNEDTGAVPPNGTGTASEPEPSCADRGDSAVPNGATGCAERGHARDPVRDQSEGTHGERASAHAPHGAPTQLALDGSPAPVPVKRAARRKPATKTKTKPAKSWRRVPESWEPTDAHRALAVEQAVDLDGELAKFRDHEFRAAKTDADAAFRTWIRNAAQFASAPARANGRTPKQSNHGIKIQCEEY